MSLELLAIDLACEGFWASMVSSYPKAHGGF